MTAIRVPGTQQKNPPVKSVHGRMMKSRASGLEHSADYSLGINGTFPCQGDVPKKGYRGLEGRRYCCGEHGERVLFVFR